MTANDIFERLIHLSDNGDESTGRYDIADNREYKYRLLAITNMLLSEVYPYSDTCVRVAGKRPAIDPVLTDFDEEIDLDDYCFNTLVYGVAARMFTDENGNIASFYEQEYERRLAYLMSGAGMVSEAESIEDVYAGGYDDADGLYHHFTGYFPHNDFGRWA